MKTRILTWLAVTLFAACSGTEVGPGTDNTGLRTFDAFCKAWAEAACNAEVVRVCESETAGCVSSQESFCRVLLPSGYNSTNAQACVDAVKDAYADAELTPEELGIVLHLAAPCDRLIKGPGGVGDTCSVDTTCNTLDDLKCVVKIGEIEGTCQIPAVVGGGQKCSGADQVCDAGFYCDGSNCLASKGQTDECSYNEECAPELRCNTAATDGGTPVGDCVDRKATGTDCTADVECQSHLCAIPRGATNGVCISLVRLSADSALCQDLR